MAHVNNFERDIEYRQHRDAVYREDANEVYTYDGDSTELLQDKKQISVFIGHHLEAQAPRLKMLNNYYEGLNFNLLRNNRRREKHLADNRAAHDFASYITDFINGYFLGTGIQIQTKDEGTQETLDGLHEINDIDSHNRSLGLDLSVYGRAYEYVIRNNKDEVRIYKSDARNTFIIYDNTIEQDSLMAVRYWSTGKDDDGNSIYNVDVITPFATYFFLANEVTNLTLEERKPPEAHSFQRVTITEYKNNEKRRGDFEKAIPLIDLYDNAQSDTANYMSDLNDAMLLVKGNVDLGDKDIVKLQKEANVFLLEPPEYENVDGNTTEGNVDAQYIYKQYDVQGVEAYKDRINRNIHMFTNTPDMSDEQFGGQQSGEAMKYKLFGLEQRAAVKEGLFRKGLRRRYKLIGEIMGVNRELNPDNVRSLVFTFTRNLPKSIKEDMEMYLSAGGKLSQSTLMTLVSFIDDPQQELDKIQDEEDKEMELSDKRMYNESFTQNQQSEGIDDNQDKKEG
ncbi:phage portal protein [Staphylococcus saprophyticus]|nr:phage portal protein [Staphylococcus saprophyticus]